MDKAVHSYLYRFWETVLPRVQGGRVTVIRSVSPPSCRPCTSQMDQNGRAMKASGRLLLLPSDALQPTHPQAALPPSILLHQIRGATKVFDSLATNFLGRFTCSYLTKVFSCFSGGHTVTDLFDSDYPALLATESPVAQPATAAWREQCHCS